MINLSFMRIGRLFGTVLASLTIFTAFALTIQAASLLVEVAPLPTASAEYPITRVQALSESDAWAFGLRGLWRTQDGGKAWETVGFPQPEQPPNTGPKLNSPPSLKGGHFESLRSGWIEVEHYNGTAGFVDSIYRTEDGGRTWRVEPPLPFQGGVNTIDFLPGGLIGWAAGAERTAAGVRVSTAPGCISPPNRSVLQPSIFYTTDGGQHWTEQQLPQPVGCPVAMIVFRNPQEGLAAAGHHLYYTVDSGRSWHASDYLASCRNEGWITEEWKEPVYVSFAGDETGWLSSQSGFLLKTADGGKSWCEIKGPGEVGSAQGGLGSFGMVSFDTLQHGFMLGSDHKIYETTDGGLTWSGVHRGDFRDLSCVRGNCWAISSNGRLYRTEQQ